MSSTKIKKEQEVSNQDPSDGSQYNLNAMDKAEEGNGDDEKMAMKKVEGESEKHNKNFAQYGRDGSPN